MICPRDANTLTATYKHGIEVDICPSCDGVWLDRGELDKILRLGGGKSSQNTESKSNGTDTSNSAMLGFSSGSGPSGSQPAAGDSSSIFDVFLDLFN